MRIQILSDLHIEFGEFELEANDADIVILAGDIHVKNKGVLWALEAITDKPVLYVLGNHEFYGKAYPTHITSLREITKGTNIHILEKNAFTIDKVNFFGCTLWTDFNLFDTPRITGAECQEIMTDFKKIRVSPRFSKLRSIDVSAIHRQSLEWLEKQLEAHKDETNIVITHHGPSLSSLPSGKESDVSSAAYVSALETFILSHSPDYWFHGHLHNSSDYQIGNCRVLCNPRGYPDEKNPEFDKNLTIEI